MFSTDSFACSSSLQTKKKLSRTTVKNLKVKFCFQQYLGYFRQYYQRRQETRLSTNTAGERSWLQHSPFSFFSQYQQTSYTRSCCAGQAVNTPSQLTAWIPAMEWGTHAGPLIQKRGPGRLSYPSDGGGKVNCLQWWDWERRRGQGSCPQPLACRSEELMSLQPESEFWLPG